MWIVRAYLDMGGIDTGRRRPAKSLMNWMHDRHAVDISTPELLGEGLFTHLFHRQEDAEEEVARLEVKRKAEGWMPLMAFGAERVDVARNPDETPQAYVLRLRSMVLPVLP